MNCLVQGPISDSNDCGKQDNNYICKIGDIEEGHQLEKTFVVSVSSSNPKLKASNETLTIKCSAKNSPEYGAQTSFIILQEIKEVNGTHHSHSDEEEKVGDSSMIAIFTIL